MTEPKFEDRVARKPRRESRVNSRLERNLLAYSAAAGAACACSLFGPPAAEGKIVYTKANVQLQNRQPFAVDFNHDGKLDLFLMFAAGATFGGSGFEYLAACHRPFAGTKGFECTSSTSASNSLNGIRVNQGKSAEAQRAGKEIRKGDSFKDKVAVGMGGVLWKTSTSGATNWGGPWVNGGKGVKNRYLGVKFKLHGRFHFAWARLTVATTPPHDFTATLTGYAYEAIPGKAIVAGQTRESQIEGNENELGVGSALSDQGQGADSGSLGRLALGAAGRIVGKAKE